MIGAGFNTHWTELAFMGSAMRADRLLSLLLLLQTHGRMTADNLAAELEVSARTVYRDIDALSAAGVPVYAERGPGGGCSLLESYRTTLTGLTEAQVRALFMLAIPAPLSQLGVGQELKVALLKLVSSLPPARRADEEWVRQRFHLDSNWWFQSEEAVPHLKAIHTAVCSDQRLVLSYRLPFGTRNDQLVDPYGLVAKAGVWYLVYSHLGNLLVQRVSKIIQLRVTNERYERPPGFDLAAFWKCWCEEYEAKRQAYRVTIRVSPEMLAQLPEHLGESAVGLAAEAGPADAAGWVSTSLCFDSFWSARDHILALGGAVQVVEPEALRRSVADLAEQIVSVYRDDKAA
jgi:predicted DNA-binding transcriptional regulator YafY